MPVARSGPPIQPHDTRCVSTDVRGNSCGSTAVDAGDSCESMWCCGESQALQQEADVSTMTYKQYLTLPRMVALVNDVVVVKLRVTES